MSTTISDYYIKGTPTKKEIILQLSSLMDASRDSFNCYDARMMSVPEILERREFFESQLIDDAIWFNDIAVLNFCMDFIEENMED